MLEPLTPCPDSGRHQIQNNPEKSLSISSQLINEWDGFETTPDEIKSSIYDVHGWGYYLNNQYDKAEEYLTKSIETNSFSASAFYHLAVVMEKTENYKTAIDYYTKAIDYAFDEEISNKANQGYQNLTK